MYRLWPNTVIVHPVAAAPGSIGPMWGCSLASLAHFDLVMYTPLVNEQP